MAPDKQHLHHRLLEIGHSHRRAVAIMWLWAALIAFGTVLASLYSGPPMWAAIGAMAAITLALTFLLPMVHRPRNGNPIRNRPRLCDSFHEHPLMPLKRSAAAHDDRPPKASFSALRHPRGPGVSRASRAVVVSRRRRASRGGALCSLLLPTFSLMPMKATWVDGR